MPMLRRVVALCERCESWSAIVKWQPCCSTYRQPHVDHVQQRRRAMLLFCVPQILIHGSLHAESEPAVRGLKWHPGHYVFVGQTRIGPQHLEGHFRGVQRLYPWSDLEPQAGQYDFSTIESDITRVRSAGRQLVLQIQYKAFGAGQRRVPEYLQGQDYGGGVFLTHTGAWDPVIWNERVGARLDVLLSALGRAFDAEPAVEAVVLPETSLGAALGMNPQPGVQAYRLPDYVAALKARMLALRLAFARTVVIQYANYPVDALPELTAFMRDNGVGLGGPDVYPRPSPLADPLRGIYRLYAPLSGVVPLGAAVQGPDYSPAAMSRTAAFGRRSRGTDASPAAQDEDPIPVREHLKLARETLKLNYLFWSAFPRANFERVKQMLAEPDLAADPAGGLVSDIPLKAFAAK